MTESSWTWTGATPPTYSPSDTALMVVDPYNDFLSEGGKVWPRVADGPLGPARREQAAGSRCD
jgi:hypothetical protein